MAITLCVPPRPGELCAPIRFLLRRDSTVLELTSRGIEVARERRRRISESLRTLLADRTPDADALIEATATHLHNLVGELEAALAEAAVRG